MRLNQPIHPLIHPYNTINRPTLLVLSPKGPRGPSSLAPGASGQVSLEKELSALHDLDGLVPALQFPQLWTRRRLQFQLDPSRGMHKTGIGYV